MNPDKDLAKWIPRLLAVQRGAIGQPEGPPDRLLSFELRSIASGVQELSAGLTRKRALVGERYFEDPRLLGAYLLFYWPISYAQVRRILPELPGRFGSILDLGSGMAPGAFAALDAGGKTALAADRSQEALQLAQDLALEAGEGLGTRRWGPGQALPDGEFDLIIAQHVFNEIWADDRQRLQRRAGLARSLLERVRPGGTLLILEPALRDTSRELLQLRDVLVAQGVPVRAPCLYRGNCPALDRASDWCHAERDWEPPPLTQALAKAAGLHKERLKMSYLALGPRGEAWAEPPPGRIFRIVSEPLHGKGRRRFMGCGPEGRMGLALQEKHVNEGNAAFEKLQRGEVIAIEGSEPKGDGIGLNAESKVTRVARPGERVC